MRIWLKVRSALLHALDHDVANTAKAAAYSGMLMLFPALLVVTTLVAQVQQRSNVLGGLRSLYEQFFPPDTLDLLQSYVLSKPLRSTQLLISASILALFAGLVTFKPEMAPEVILPIQPVINFFGLADLPAKPRIPLP